jgi:hypothetical protein
MIERESIVCPLFTQEFVNLSSQEFITFRKAIKIPSDLNIRRAIEAAKFILFPNWGCKLDGDHLDT